ncbi:MAG: choice-of-anchor Q domain-containing protein [Planctomycetota bacterium]
MPFRSRKRRQPTHTPVRGPSRRRLRGETLEARRLLAVDFQFEYDNTSTIGFNDPVEGPAFRAALETAAERLGDDILADATITLRVTSRDFDGGNIAGAQSVLPDALTGGGFIQPLVMQKILGGADFNGSDVDGFVEVFFFEPADALSYELDPNDVQTDELDFGAVIFHELVHLIGWTSATNANGADDNGGGLTTPGTYLAYDQFLSDSNGDRLIESDPNSANAFRMDTSTWDTLSIGGSGDDGLHFAGPMAVSVYGGPVPLFSPDLFSPASSVIHLDTEIVGGTSIFNPAEVVMTHGLPTGPVTQELSLVEKAILSDLGILLREDIAPVLQLPTTTLILEGNATNGFDTALDDGALAAYVDSVTATDQVDPNPSVIIDPPDTFGLGIETVDVTAVDASGNATFGSLTILVRDTTPPEITADVTELTLEATGPEGWSGTLPAMLSAVDVVDPNPSLSPPPSTLSLGNNNVNFTATDVRGNESTLDLPVSVVDTTSPTLTVPATLTIPSDAPGGATTQNASLLRQLADASEDLVDQELSFSFDLSAFVLGTQTVTVTASDDSGNSAQATFDLEVVDAAIVVTTLDDELDVDPETDPADVSLREAIAIANGDLDRNLIRFDAGLDGTITLDAGLGTLRITDSLRLIGNGSGDGETVIDGDDAIRVLLVTAAAEDVTLESLQITGGRTSEDLAYGAGILFEAGGTLRLDDVAMVGNRTSGAGAAGAAVQTETGNLEIVDSRFTANFTSGEFAGGGAIWTAGPQTTLTRSVLTGNGTEGGAARGGAILALNGNLQVTQTLIENNTTSGPASRGGGLVTLSNSATIRDSTLAGNSTLDGNAGGGAIFAQSADLTLINTTLSGNTAALSSGGGILSDRSDLTVIQSTIVDNEAGTVGGGIDDLDTEFDLIVLGSIVADNFDDGTAPDLSIDTDAGDRIEFSIIGDNTGSNLFEAQTAGSDGNLIGSDSGAGTIDPQLQTLDDNGGPLPTHAPEETSPAINAGDPNFDPGAVDPPLNTDARGEGFARVFGNRIDIGAVERVLSVSVQWDPIDAVTYPTPLSATQLNATANVPGVFTYSPPLGSLLQVEEDRVIRVTFTPTNTAFSPVLLENTITVLPGTPLVEFPQPTAISLGTELSGVELAATANISGDFAYTPDVGTVLPAGVGQTLSVTFTPNDTRNWVSVTETTTIDVVGNRDYGDAPAPYATTLAADGARHGTDASNESTLFLGDLRSVESGPASPPNDSDADDDGVRFLTPLIVDAAGPSVGAVAVTASETGRLDAWIDFNNDGVWQSTEQIATSLDLVGGENVVSFAVPDDAASGATVFGRFRVSSAGGLGPTGDAADGEVEDWSFQLVAPGDGPIVVDAAGRQAAVAIEEGRVRVRFGDVIVSEFDAQAGIELTLIGSTGNERFELDASIIDALDSLSIDGLSGRNTVAFMGDGTFDLSATSLDLQNIRILDTSDAGEQILRFGDTEFDRLSPGAQIVELILGVDDSLDYTDRSGWSVADTTPDNASSQIATGEDGSRRFEATVDEVWQNFINPSDVDGNGGVTPADALRILNAIRRGDVVVDSETTLLPPASTDLETMLYYDQNGSGTITPLDALRVLNQVRRQNSSGGEGERVEFGDLSSDGVRIDSLRFDELDTDARRRFLASLDDVFGSSFDDEMGRHRGI